MKKIILLMAVILCMPVISSCTKEEGRNTPSFTLIHASDLHYIADELTDHGKSFTDLLNQGDGKLTFYCDELTEAFLSEVIDQKPDALVISGDLTFNGAVQSHKALAEKLKKVEAAGIDVFVLSGNHDVYNHNAASFAKDSYTFVPHAESEDFKEIYADFGFDEAIAQDQTSLSYVVQLNENTRLLMLDTNSKDTPCGIADSSLLWVEKQLKDAKEAGQYMLAFSHQNLMQHSMFKRGYVIQGAEEIIRLFEAYGVELSLCGHLHMQHTMTKDTLTEIAVSSLAVTPCQYGLLQAEKGSLTYQTQSVDVEAWAKEQGSQDENLLNFKDYAQSYMDAMTTRQSYHQLIQSDFTPEEQQLMIDYACKANRAYFAGDMSGFLNENDEKAFKLWESSDTFSAAYIASMAEEFGKNHTYWNNTK